MGKRKRKKDRDDKPITWVVIGMMIVIAIFGWGTMASAYEQWQISLSDEDPDYMPARSGTVLFVRSIIVFTITAIRQLPNMVNVIIWNLRSNFWMPAAIVGLEGGAIFFGFGLKYLEVQLQDPYAKQKAKRKSDTSDEDSPPRKRKKKRRR